MLKQIEDFCQEYNMLHSGDRVLVCVSGGADSMCLLHVMRALAPKYGLQVFAAHYNHNLRGAESDGDEAFVREYCEKLGIPLFVGSGDVSATAEKLRRGTEETARQMRYAFFFRTAGLEGMDRVATAHTGDDDIETVLMRLTRGTGLRGLCGIPPTRGKLIRPLLELTRADIEAYNAENGVPHREDSSNSSDDYTRNRIRHAVVPVLRELNPALSVAGMTRLLRRDEEYLDGLARAFIRENSIVDALPAPEVLALPYPVASRVIRDFCGGELTRDHVDRVLDLMRSPDPSAKLDIPGSRLRREYSTVVKGDAPARSFPPTPVILDSSVIIEGTDFTVTCEECAFSGGIYNSLTTFYIKRDKIAGKLIVRPRSSGDTLTLSGGTVSLKKIMIDRKIPRSRRDAIPVVADDSGPLAVWSLGQNVKYLPALGEPAIKIEIEERKR